MKIRNRIFICLAIIMAILAINNKVQAASATISASAKEVVVGTKVKITTKIKGAAWDITLSGAVSAEYADSTADAEDTTKTETISFTPSKEGTYTVSFKGNVTGSNDRGSTPVSGSITIKAKKKTTDKTTDKPTDNTTTISTDATLKNLGITPNDFSGFSKSTTIYNVAVPKATEKISIYATPTDSKATATGAGSKSLQIGKNSFNIKVTAADKKTTKTYTLNITRKDTSTDATLSNLGIRPKEYDFTGFKMSTLDYKVSVPNKVEKINIYAYATDRDATISGAGEQKLNVGENKFNIKVTAADKKTTKTYNLTVTRKEDEEEPEEKEEQETSSTGVTNITVAGYTLTPKFSPETYEYTLDIPSSNGKLDVNVETEKGVEAEVVGNEDLKSGENVITVLVRDTKTDATTIYQIKANVGTAESENTDVNLTEINSEINQVQSNLKKRDWIIRGTIIAIIILIIIYLIQRYRAGEDYYEDDEEEEEEVSETKNFYEQMKEKYLDEYVETEENTENPEPRRKGKYKGKRFK